MNNFNGNNIVLLLIKYHKNIINLHTKITTIKDVAFHITNFFITPSNTLFLSPLSKTTRNRHIDVRPYIGLTVFHLLPLSHMVPATIFS